MYESVIEHQAVPFIEVTTKRELDEALCACCLTHGEPLLLRPKCHPDSPVYIIYAGALSAVCATCRGHVLSVELR